VLGKRVATTLPGFTPMVERAEARRVQRA
jgi:hypothetical protein